MSERKHPLAHCEDCPYNSSDIKAVFGTGPEYGAELAVVGGSPDQYDSFSGRPFVGPVGQILDEVLRNNDIRREDVWVTHAVACMPLENATPAQAAITACAPRLFSEIGHAVPDYIVATGGKAAEAFGLKGAMKGLRVGPPKLAEIVFEDGSGVEWRPTFPVIPTWDLGYAMRLPDALPSIDFDFAKTGKGTTGAVWQEPTCIVVDDWETAIQAMQELEDMPGPFSVDIETGFEKDESDFHADQRPLICIGVGYEKNKVVIFGKSLMPYAKFHARLGRLFREKPLIMHNGKSDVAGMMPTMGPTNLRYDTMLEHYTLDERTGGHSLGILGVELLGAPDWKSWTKQYLAKGKEKNFADIPLDVLYRYNAIDCAVTYDLHAMFWPELEKQGRTGIHDHMVEAANQLVYPEMDGIGFDMPYSMDLTAQLQDEISDVEQKINDLLSGADVEVPVLTYDSDTDVIGTQGTVKVNFNPRSPQQIQALFRDRGWHIPTEKKKATTAAPALARALERGLYDEHPVAQYFLALLFEHRTLSKDDGTFVRGLQKEAVKQADGSYRIHTTYTLHVTSTGRLSSKSPNLQNVKDNARLRRQFVAAPDNLFLQGDYSQVEGRAIAVLSGDEYLGSLFRNADRDIFDELSIAMYGKLIKEKRRMLKTYFYGQAYGRTAHGIAKGFGIPIDEAEEGLKAFKALIPQVGEWQEKTWQQVQDDGYLETTFGRRRHFPLITNRNATSMKNEALAFVPQSTASDICLRAFTEMRPELEINYGDQGRIRLTIHDAIVTEVVASRELEMQEDMRHFMERSGNRWSREQDSDVPFEVAFKSGPSWDQL